MDVAFTYYGICRLISICICLEISPIECRNNCSLMHIYRCSALLNSLASNLHMKTKVAMECVVTIMTLKYAIIWAVILTLDIIEIIVCFLLYCIFIWFIKNHSPSHNTQKPCSDKWRKIFSLPRSRQVGRSGKGIFLYCSQRPKINKSDN